MRSKQKTVKKEKAKNTKPCFFKATYNYEFLEKIVKISSGCLGACFVVCLLAGVVSVMKCKVNYFTNGGIATALVMLIAIVSNLVLICGWQLRSKPASIAFMAVNGCVLVVVLVWGVIMGLLGIACEFGGINGNGTHSSYVKDCKVGAYASYCIKEFEGLGADSIKWYMLNRAVHITMDLMVILLGLFACTIMGYLIFVGFKFFSSSSRVLPIGSGNLKKETPVTPSGSGNMQEFEGKNNLEGKIKMKKMGSKKSGLQQTPPYPVQQDPFMPELANTPPPSPVVNEQMLPSSDDIENPNYMPPPNRTSKAPTRLTMQNPELEPMRRPKSAKKMKKHPTPPPPRQQYDGPQEESSEGGAPPDMIVATAEPDVKSEKYPDVLPVKTKLRPNPPISGLGPIKSKRSGKASSKRQSKKSRNPGGLQTNLEDEPYDVAATPNSGSFDKGLGKRKSEQYLDESKGRELAGADSIHEVQYYSNDGLSLPLRPPNVTKIPSIRNVSLKAWEMSPMTPVARLSNRSSKSDINCRPTNSGDSINKCHCTIEIENKSNDTMSTAHSVESEGAVSKQEATVPTAENVSLPTLIDNCKPSTSSKYIEKQIVSVASSTLQSSNQSYGDWTRKTFELYSDISGDNDTHCENEIYIVESP